MKYLATILFMLLSFCSCAQKKNSKVVTKDNQPSIQLANGKDSFHYFTLTDTNYSVYNLPRNFSKTKKWLDKEIERSKKWRHDYYSPYPKTFTLQDALDIIDTATDFGKIRMAKSWCIDNYNLCFQYLVPRLSYKTKVGLTNSADLIIWERMGTGDLQFYGHGGGMDEDIFTIAGRASWILNDLTGENFAVVHGDLTETQATNFKRLWVDYLSKLKE